MYTKSKRLMISGIASLLATTLYAGELTIPNTFSANTKAKASEVNANFTAVKNVVNENMTGIASSTKLDNNILLTNLSKVIVSLTVNAPRDGYLHLFASGTFIVEKKTNLRGYISASINDNQSTNSDEYNTVAYSVAATLAEGTYVAPFFIQTVLPITSGAHTYYLEGFQNNADNSYLDSPKLVGIFYTNNIK